MVRDLSPGSLIAVGTDGEVSAGIAPVSVYYACAVAELGCGVSAEAVRDLRPGFLSLR